MSNQKQIKDQSFCHQQHSRSCWPCTSCHHRLSNSCCQFFLFQVLMMLQLVRNFPPGLSQEQSLTSYAITFAEEQEVYGPANEKERELVTFDSSITIAEAMTLPLESRLALVFALFTHEKDQTKILHTAQATCMTTISFSDEDLQLGSHLQNRPLYVGEHICNCKLSHALIDPGSAVNIMPIRTMKKLSITANELSRSKLVIQGFNQRGQHAGGMINQRSL